MDGNLQIWIHHRNMKVVTARDICSLLRMSEGIYFLENVATFSILDANWGYWQFPIADVDKDEAKFTGCSDIYWFNCMLFGQMNAPAIFQRCSDIILGGILWKTCVAYIDIIIIFSQDFQYHINNNESLLNTLHKTGVYLKQKKHHHNSSISGPRNCAELTQHQRGPHRQPVWDAIAQDPHRALCFPRPSRYV